MSNNGSVFLAPDQSGPNTQLQAHASGSLVYSAGDAAKSIGTSITSVKRLATELRLDIQQTVGGLWLFSEDQVSRIKAELARRQTEALK